MYILQKIEFWLLEFIVEGIKNISYRIRILFQSFDSLIQNQYERHIYIYIYGLLIFLAVYSLIVVTISQK